MNKLVEMAHRKFLVGRGDNGSSSKGGYNKVPKQAAMGFAKRTLARCQKFEDTGLSCFSEPPFHDVILSAPLSACNTKTSIVAGSCPHDSQSSASGFVSNVVERHELLSKKIEKGSLNSFQGVQDQAFAKQESVPNRGKKMVLVDDVAGNPLSRTTYIFGDNLPDGAKGKRTVVKAGRPLLGAVRGERKTKSRPKLKTTQLSTSGHGLLERPTETINDILSLAHKPGEAVNGGNSKVNNLADSQCNGGFDQDRSKKVEEKIDYSHMILHADSVEDLGVSDELCGEGQDIGSWLMIDEDIGGELGVPDDLNGLPIPMDDLSDLNMNF